MRGIKRSLSRGFRDVDVAEQVFLEEGVSLKTLTCLMPSVSPGEFLFPR